MPTPNSSRGENTTRKIITDEMQKNLTVDQLYDLRMQGWEYEKPVKDWRDLMPKMDKADDEHSTYFGSVGLRRREEPADARDPVEDDPELQKIANQLGVRTKDLLLFREMMLDRYGDRYSDTQDDEWGE
jgi:hypothetical protein